MRSLSSTVSEMPSSCEPSRSVVSYTSTWSGVDMLEPVLVAVVLAAHGRGEDLLDLARDRARIAELAVVDRTDRHDLGRGTRQERFLRDIEIAARDVGE